MGGGGPRRPGALPLLALALLAAQGGAAPLQPAGSPAITKMYPRGSHWAVGHLMGKKSTGDFPYVYEEENKTPFSAVPENIKQLEDYLQWEEISKYLLQLLEGNENKSAHFLKGGLPWYTRNSWGRDDSSSWKDFEIETNSRRNQPPPLRRVLATGKQPVGLRRDQKKMMDYLLQVVNMKESTPS